MPAERIPAVKARVGKRGFSAYVSAAVEAEVGPPGPEVEEWAEEVFRRAEAKAAAQRAARLGHRP
ncbi:hypothetical protein ACFPM3_10205 [Streptomyces coeruleoprunus]|uniref:Uncharacterized protein n=1 Tax=Streptomyces coeruleoprunus TaxID=285563 RepID=A0ABV9XCW7_9ACTN